MDAGHDPARTGFAANDCGAVVRLWTVADAALGSYHVHRWCRQTTGPPLDCDEYSGP
jgi:hypothetical protein